MTRLVQTLANGPLDIIGDVHGEIELLIELVARLGYDARGVHPRKRRLVFVGDLTDRGPDSPAVVRFVRRLVDADRAQCVLGNHDLNILLGLRKFDNPWFYGQEFRTPSGHLLPQQLADDATRDSILDFFASLPIALERPGLRVVHAFWDSPMIALARAASSAVALHEEHRERIDAEHRGRSERDPIVRELDHQNLNPITLLTSGPEERAQQPAEASGKLRLVQRVKWWPGVAAPSSKLSQLTAADSASHEVCVFGHYALPRGTERANHSAFCIDYGAGKRSLERLSRVTRFTSKLAALRWPERQILFDDGLSESWGPAAASVDRSENV